MLLAASWSDGGITGVSAGDTVTLTFSDSPTRLREWSLTDGQGQVTQMRINLQPASGLDPSLFVLRDPRAKAPAGGPP